MQERKLRIVKLTPIALASCEACHASFESYQRVEDDAEREMKALFEQHDCVLQGNGTGVAPSGEDD
jgi:hypothetical protein